MDKFTRPYLSKYIAKMDNSKATRKPKKSSFMKGLLSPQLPSRWRVNAMRNELVSVVNSAYSF